MVVKSMAQYRIIAIIIYILYKHLKTNLGYSISSGQLGMINQCLQQQLKFVVSSHQNCSLIFPDKFSTADKLPCP